MKYLPLSQPADLGVFAVAATGVLCAFCGPMDALPEHCLRPRPRANLLVAAAFRAKRLLRTAVQFHAYAADTPHRNRASATSAPAIFGYAPIPAKARSVPPNCVDVVICWWMVNPRMNWSLGASVQAHSRDLHVPRVQMPARPAQPAASPARSHLSHK